MKQRKVVSGPRFRPFPDVPRRGRPLRSCFRIFTRQLRVVYPLRFHRHESFQLVASSKSPYNLAMGTNAAVMIARFGFGFEKRSSISPSTQFAQSSFLKLLPSLKEQAVFSLFQIAFKPFT